MPEATGDDALLRATGLGRRFGGLAAVDGVSLALRVGEIHAVIGTNGAGKSTLINMLSGELAPSAGQIVFAGHDITRWPQPKRARAGLGRSYQRTTIFPEFSVFENCRLAAQARAPRPWAVWQRASRDEASLAAAAAALASAGLADAAPRHAGTLSHGAKRQLEIAMCLATQPKVLLLDEPLAGMGAEETGRMLALLSALKATHAILLVEHDMDAVFRVADRITVMVNGQVIAHDVPDRIRVDPAVREAYLGEDEAPMPATGAATRPPEGARPAGAPVTALLALTDLHARYGDSHVLRGVSLEIPAGVSVGLLGRNGMGKTTLIRTAMGYVRAADGGVAWQGKAMTGAPPERMARLGIGYVPEGRGIFANLSVRENLVMAARRGPTGARDWTFERVLATFPRLGERMGHGGQQLSGGEQQMLAIGRALMTNPQLLILDEATEGLAPLVVAEIWRVISQIRSTGIATLIVDRNARAVLAHTDRAVVLEKGQVVMAGTSAELAADPVALQRHLGL